MVARLAALRIAGAYATNRAVGQLPAIAGETPREGVLVIRPFGRGEVYVSGAATTESAVFANVPAGLSDALRTLTVARYGRVEKIDSMSDEAMQTAIRVTKEQQSAHSLIKEWGNELNVVGGGFAKEGLVLTACRPDDLTA